MSFDLSALRAAVARHGKVTRIVVVKVKGSAPRDVGASMLVWSEGQSGTIGGGALELDAATRARRAVHEGDWTKIISLGPGLGQCCGGAVTLLAENYDVARLDSINSNYVLRKVHGDYDTPLPIKVQLQDARNSGAPVDPIWTQGWMLEPVTTATRHLWIYGAGHVGRAIVSVMAPFPEIEITWVDSAPGRYPDHIEEGVVKLVAKNPADVVKVAPPTAEHLILTYSHAIDLEICHRLLHHGFGSAGLIGSKTKWARFRAKLQDLGHSQAQISQITCPIGQPELGKHPQAIAVGVSAWLLSQSGTAKYLQQRVG